MLATIRAEFLSQSNIPYKGINRVVDVAALPFSIDVATLAVGSVADGVAVLDPEERAEGDADVGVVEVVEAASELVFASSFLSFGLRLAQISSSESNRY